LNAPERAPLGVPGKGERCGSEGACAPLDSANGLNIQPPRRTAFFSSNLLVIRRSHT
jgi:hypothetical protein